ncbi:MAG: glycosyltransferase [Butyrivibrio sp.]|nr:glycosyltransferase [Butyrivibrio sp.]
MSIKDSVRKTIAYAKRNGISAAYYAAMERLDDNKKDNYEFSPVSKEEIDRQRTESERWQNDNLKLPLFSIVVPCYLTPEMYLRKLIDSVQKQSYGKFELILADAGASQNIVSGNVSTNDENKKRASVEDIAKEYSQKDNRIIYIPLKNNGGISDNTNEGIKMAKGDYIALLDHDDYIEPNALYEFAKCIIEAQEKKKDVRLIYSDEDKTNSDGSAFYEHHAKPDFNFDYLMSNNYICHFTVIRKDIIKDLMLRKAYDGAQDFDLFIRACTYKQDDLKNIGEGIKHIDKVLYHWRCHESSTASNPTSKAYAYTAGKNAVTDFWRSRNIDAKVEELPHVGFYRTNYSSGILRSRPDIGIVGGKIVDKKGSIIGGAYNFNGEVLYNKLQKGYSGGFQHKAVLQQDVNAVDARCMQIRDELKPLYNEVFGREYIDTLTQVNAKVNENDIINLSICFCKKATEMGYRVLWDPHYFNVISGRS